MGATPVPWTLRWETLLNIANITDLTSAGGEVGNFGADEVNKRKPARGRLGGVAKERINSRKTFGQLNR